MTLPSIPTYLCQPSGDAISIAIRLVTSEGKIDSLYSEDCCSNAYQFGIEITRTPLPCCSNSFAASTAKLTSDPDANNKYSSCCSVSKTIYAPFLTPFSTVCLSTSKVGKFWRVNTNDVGVCSDSSATSQATRVSLPSAGRITFMLGIARRPANCSIGSCVGPSSPTAIESWVKMNVELSPMIDDNRKAGFR